MKGLKLPSGRHWLTVTRDERPDSDSWWWDEDPDDDLTARSGLHLMLTTSERVLAIALEAGELVIRTRHRYFQPALSVQAHLLRREGRWLCVQAGTRTWWLWNNRQGKSRKEEGQCQHQS